MYRMFYLPKPVLALILILLGAFTYIYGPLIAAVIVKIVGALIVLIGIIMLVSWLVRMIKPHT